MGYSTLTFEDIQRFEFGFYSLKIFNPIPSLLCHTTHHRASSRSECRGSIKGDNTLTGNWISEVNFSRLRSLFLCRHSSIQKSVGATSHCCFVMGGGRLEGVVAVAVVSDLLSGTDKGGIDNKFRLVKNVNMFIRRAASAVFTCTYTTPQDVYRTELMSWTLFYLAI